MGSRRTIEQFIRNNRGEYPDIEKRYSELLDNPNMAMRESLLMDLADEVEAIENEQELDAEEEDEEYWGW